MVVLRRFLAVCLMVLIAAPVARAQQHVVDKSTLERSIKVRVAEQRDDREAIRSLLRRADVKQIADKAGLSLARAEAAVATLEGEELRELARQARQAQNDLSGGASTIVISTTTIIIVLLIIILIVVIAD